MNLKVAQLQMKQIESEHSSSVIWAQTQDYRAETNSASVLHATSPNKYGLETTAPKDEIRKTPV